MMAGLTVRSGERPDAETAALCRQLINCGDRVLEIGAHAGHYARLLSDLVLPDGRVTAIEPDQQYDSLDPAPLDFIRINREGCEPAAFHNLAVILKRSPRLKILCQFSPCSLWAADFSPIAFLEQMRAQGFHLLVQDQQAWRTGSFDEITLALQQIPALAATQFISNLNRADGDQAVSRQMAAFLEQHGYRRPLSENMLFVAPGAWQTVLATLGLDQSSGKSADTVTKTDWRLRWASAHDQDVLLSLFTRAFGQSMPPSLWNWKYAESCRQGIMAHIAGKAVAYYGGIPRPFWLHEKELMAVQICDVMVAPEVRGILTRRGAFAQTAETFLRAQTGPDKPCRLAFGFPTGRAAQLGERLGMYARGDTFFEASWTTGQATRLPFWLKVEPLHEGNLAVLDKLWQGMRQSMGDYVLPRKDAGFFRWRYLEHPLNTYHIYLVSWRGFGKAIGAVVLRDHDVGQGLELMDFVGRPDVFELLLRASLNIAVQTNRQRVFSWMTSRVIAMLPSPSAQFEISGVYIDPPALKEMTGQHQDHWWFLGGDTDFR
jgi:hypothetical protein